MEYIRGTIIKGDTLPPKCPVMMWNEGYACGNYKAADRVYVVYDRLKGNDKALSAFPIYARDISEGRHFG